MEKEAFLNRIKSLNNIDGHLLPELSSEQQALFVADPIRYFIRSGDEQSDAIWREIEKRQSPGSAWQPIETAPKSTSTPVISNGKVIGNSVKGKYLLGFCPEESVNDPASCISVIWWEPNENGGRGCWFAEGAMEVRPTRWQPLPAPPGTTP